MPQVLQHMGVCGRDAGSVHVTHQDPEEQQVGGTEPWLGPSLQNSRSARAWSHSPSPGRPAHGTYQAGQGPVLQGGPLVGQVGQQLCVSLGSTADEGPAVRFLHLCQAAERLGGHWEGRRGALRVTVSPGACSAHTAGCRVGRALTCRRAAGQGGGARSRPGGLVGRPGWPGS